MDIEVGIDFDLSKFKENLLSLRNYISLGFRCDDIDFKNAAIASIDRMMEEVLDEHDVNFFDALQNVIDNLDEINTVDNVHGIYCEFYHVMDENDRMIKDAVLYVDHLGQRIACSADEFRKKFGVRK